MEYKFLDNIDFENTTLPDTGKMNSFLLKNHSPEILKALDFLNNEEKFLYIHGFLGTGKRQFINYISDFMNKEVLLLEYYCKPSTVSDDILLSFINIIEKSSLSKAVNHTAKIATLVVKFKQYISSIKKPFVIILHSFDNITEENRKFVIDCIKNISDCDNFKVIISTRAMIQNVLGDIPVDKKIFLKAFSKEIFAEYVNANKIQATDDAINDFYKFSRGYYYYTALSIKILQALNISLNDFLTKFSMSGESYDSYIGITYLELIPNAIRNFFWFLLLIRHGISLNALAILELYDDFSIGYLKNNLMIFQADEIIYIQDYFQQDIDVVIPPKIEIKLHKYIINIYEKELKENLQDRVILMSRQALRAEIEYHKKQLFDLENNNSRKTKEKTQTEIINKKTEKEQTPISEEQLSLNSKISSIKKLAEEKKYNEAIEGYLKISDDLKDDSNNLAEIRVELARLYYATNQYSAAQHYYELAESYYSKKKEYINLNYLYYELTQLYFTMYKSDRAIETAKKVIFSVDTPMSLMIDSCILLGDIYNDSKNPKEAYKYYMQALESTDENISEEKKAELYFKIALVCDEKEDTKTAFEYYNKCIQTDKNKSFCALAYSNMGACYFEAEDYTTAEEFFLKAYSIEKENNNYDGIYYTASYLAKIYTKNNESKALEYLIAAKQSAEFLNEDFYILEASIALGDYYYNHKEAVESALVEYFKAKKIALNFSSDAIDISKINERIQDMKLRMDKADFDLLEAKYG